MKTKVTAHPYRDFELTGWEGAADAYADTFESATRLYASALLDAVELKSGTELLDVACGTGHLTQLALERGAKDGRRFCLASSAPPQATSATVASKYCGRCLGSWGGGNVGPRLMSSVTMADAQLEDMSGHDNHAHVEC